MKSNWWICGCMALLLVAPCWAADTTATAPVTAAETPAQKAERMKWWVDARFGMFIHWGPVSLKGTEIGWSRGHEVPIAVYDNLYKEFNPVKFDAKQYVAIPKETGMRYITLVTKHHDGFSMFATKLSDYNIMHTPFRRDVVKELADECQKQGVRFCTYYSIVDWYHPDYLPRGAGDQRPPKDAHFDNYYKSFLKGQLREIVTNYHPGMIWFDGEWEDHWTVERGRDVYAMLRQLDPAIITNNRLGKNRGFLKGGMTPPESTVGDFHTPEQESGRFSGDRNVYWESCVTLGEQWAWKPHDKLKTPRSASRCWSTTPAATATSSSTSGRCPAARSSRGRSSGCGKSAAGRSNTARASMAPAAARSNRPRGASAPARATRSSSTSFTGRAMGR